MTQFIPPWMDTVTLAKHICVSPGTIDNWVAQGILPPGRKRGGKIMFKWTEVDERLTMGNVSPDTEAERIRNNVRKAAAENRLGH